MHAAYSVPAIEGQKTHYPVIVIGAGQAGMAMSFWLKEHNIDHLILERASAVAHNWEQERWDAFCLVTPNWQCQLPGHPYQGNDPDGFMVKDEIVDYLRDYYRVLSPPVEFNSPVKALTRSEGLYHINTDHQTYSADQVVLACGSYHQPTVLPQAKGIPESITQLHTRDYKNPDQLPPGDVMVIGTGQSGCQIAEDLHLAGRKVHLCVGHSPRVNRRYRGKDVVKWLDEMGYYQTTIDNHPDGENAPHSTNHYVTGRDGGRDLNLRVFAEQGMQLYGRLNEINKGVASFHNDLYESLDYADEVAARIRTAIEQYIVENDIAAPEDDNLHSQFQPPTTTTLDLNNTQIGSIIWATGFRMNFDWVDLPIFDNKGHPQHKRGVTNTPGLYFLGLNWMHTWGSGRFFQVGDDAQFLASLINEDRKSDRRLG